jgi:uncharacterized protein (DUF362 family)
VGLARAEPSYRGLAPPFDPGAAYPELARLLPDAARAAPPNHVYAGVRAALHALGLDASRFGTPAWNPLGGLLPPGGRVVLKPNFIRHWNPNAAASLDSVITHGSVVRALADYARLAAGPEGRVAIAEAPQHDCDFEEIRCRAGLDAIAGVHRSLGAELEIIDLRREEVRYRGGVIAERRALPGDPAGYRLVDVGRHSAFEGSGLDPRRFRGADYDCTPTTEHHVGGRHEYLLSETVLSADLVVNLPKLKTHKKTGVTLALKNLVGINGDKNLLPHHCQGPESAGGDEYPGASWLDAARSRATELARGWLARGRGAGLVRAVRRIERGTRGDAFVRSGNWWGNRTTWRMCLDLNRALYYSDARGPHFDAAAPVRRVLTVLDGIVAGEGEGPLAPDDRPLGVILASLDPIALDLAAIRLMGFDEDRIPKVREALRGGPLPLTTARRPEDVRIFEAARVGAPPRELPLDALEPDAGGFRPHPGWSGHVEKTSCAA